MRGKGRCANLDKNDLDVGVVIKKKKHFITNLPQYKWKKVILIRLLGCAY